MLDSILRRKDRLSSEFEDNWVEGCREGMAIALDIVSGSLQDVAIRGSFEGKPVRIRYYKGKHRTVKDPSLITSDPIPY